MSQTTLSTIPRLIGQVLSVYDGEHGNVVENRSTTDPK